MPEFLDSNQLNNEIAGIIENARKYLVLISPYIKLHERLIASLKTIKDNPLIAITLVFGKNRSDYSKSIRHSDFEFLKDFPDIEIRYEKRLHAKYYANERYSILTSMNLYDRSQDNNIEAGILMNGSYRGLLPNLAQKVLTTLKSTPRFEDDANDHFVKIVEQADILYKRTPQFENSLFGISKNYIESIVEIDQLTEFFIAKRLEQNMDLSKESPSHSIIQSEVLKNGYCIRTGIPIPFNLNKPMCEKSLNNWEKFKNKNYPEKYCHFSGEPSFGKTTFAYPVLEKYWDKVRSKVA